MECETHQVCAVAKPLVDRADCHYLQQRLSFSRLLSRAALALALTLLSQGFRFSTCTVLP